MGESENEIPPEIISFSISKNSLMEIVGGEIGGKIKSIDFEDGSLNVVISDSLLRTIVGNRYSGEIKSVEIINNEAEIEIENT